MNTPDSLVESSHFISIAHLVSSDYTPPGRKIIGGKFFVFYFLVMNHSNSKPKKIRQTT